MKQISMSVWQAVDALVASIPFSKDKVERALHTVLADTGATDSDVFRFYRGMPVQLADNVEVAEIDLRLRRQGPHPGFLVLQLKGREVSFDEVLLHYEKLMITEIPRGRSLDEVASYTATLAWGRLSFGFSERNPECLDCVVFKPF